MPRWPVGTALVLFSWEMGNEPASAPPLCEAISSTMVWFIAPGPTEIELLTPLAEMRLYNP